MWSGVLIVVADAGREERWRCFVAIRASMSGRMVLPSERKELVEKHKVRRRPVEFGSLGALVNVSYHV
jgi:hypothetical protein